MDQPRSWGFDCSETAQLEFFVGGFFLLKDLMLGMGIRRIHKEIHGMAPKCFVAAVFWNLEMPMSEEQPWLK